MTTSSARLYGLGSVVGNASMWHRAGPSFRFEEPSVRLGSMRNLFGSAAAMCKRKRPFFLQHHQNQAIEAQASHRRF